jgi:hypothetical protein
VVAHFPDLDSGTDEPATGSSDRFGPGLALSAVILVFGAQRRRLSEEDARWISTSWGDANLVFVERIAPKLKAAIESEQETEIVVDEDMRQDLVVIFERIEAAGYMTRRMRPVQEAAATPITLPPSP